jgi:uncharacterized membrane protein
MKFKKKQKKILFVILGIIVLISVLNLVSAIPCNYEGNMTCIDNSVYLCLDGQFILGEICHTLDGNFTSCICGSLTCNVKHLQYEDFAYCGVPETPIYWTIILVVVIIAGITGGLLFLYLKTRKKRKKRR